MVQQLSFRAERVNELIRRELVLLLKNETKPSKIEELQEKKQAILNARNANLKIPSNFSIVTKEKIFDLITALLIVFYIMLSLILELKLFL